MGGLNSSVITGKCSGCTAYRGKLKKAREKLEAVEKLPLRHDKLPHATGGGCMSRCLACQRDRILRGGD